MIKLKNVTKRESIEFLYAKIPTIEG